MRDTKNLTLAKPQLVVNESWRVTTIQIQNPTGANVLVRQGGTDYPTMANADRIVTPASTFQFPALGTVFAFTFDNTSLLGTLSFPTTRAIVELLDANERVGNLGSISPTPRPVYYDSRSHPLMVVKNFNAGVAPHGLIQRWAYVVPANRQAFVESATVSCTRASAATTPATMQLEIDYLSASGGGGIIVTFLNYIDNVVGSQKFDHQTQYGSMFAGDQLTAQTVDTSTGGTNAMILTAKIVEFDA